MRLRRKLLLMTLVAAACCFAETRLMAQIDPLAPAPAPGPGIGAAPAPGILDKDEALGPDSIEIDTIMMLTWPTTMTNLIQDDPLWRLGAAAGIYGEDFVQIPFRCDPKKEGDIKLEKSTFSVSNAKFVCYRVPSKNFAYDGDNTSGGQFHHRNRRKRETGGDLGPNSPPRITTEIIMRPDNTLSWKIDRYFRTYGQMQSSAQQYRWKLDVKALQAKRPKKPRFSKDPRVRRGQLAAFRASQKSFLDLQSRIRKLPSRVEEPMGKFIWLVVVVDKGVDEIVIDGPKPLPWKLSLRQMRDMRRLMTPINETEFSKNASGKPDKSTYPIKRLENFRPIAESINVETHPYTIKMAATFFSSAKLLQWAEPGDLFYNTALNLMSKGDTRDRTLVAKAIASVLPPTRATFSLMKQLRGLLPANFEREVQQETIRVKDYNNAAEVQSVIDQIHKLMLDPSGPDAPSLMDKLLDIANKKPGIVPTLVEKTPIEKLPVRRRADVIRYALEHASSSTMCARIVTERLLKPKNLDLVKQTLAMLNAATLKSQGGKPGSDTPVLESRVKIEDTSHPLFDLLVHEDPAIKKAAWTSLRNFDMQKGIRPARPNRFDKFIEATLLQRTTPPIGIAFLARQNDKAHEPFVMESLVKMVQRGDSATKIQAARAIVTRKGTLLNLLVNMSAEERAAFIRRLYEANLGTTPLVVGMMKLRSRDNPLLLWFSNSIVAGQLPDSKGWAAAFVPNQDYRDEKLLAFLSSFDQDLSKAALGALVAEAGGDDEQTLALLTKWKQEGSLSDIDVLWKKWQKARQRIFAQRLGNDKGRYQLRVEFEGQSAVVATGDIRVEDVRLKLGDSKLAMSVPYQQFGIRLNKPSQLKDLAGDRLRRIPVEAIRKYVDLLPFQDRWVGRASFGADVGIPRVIQFWLEPIR